MRFRTSLIPIFIILTIITIGCIHNLITSYVDKKPLWMIILFALWSICVPCVFLLELKKDLRPRSPLSFTSQLTIFPLTFGFCSYEITSSFLYDKTQWGNNQVTNIALIIGLFVYASTFLFIVLKRKIRS